MNLAFCGKAGDKPQRARSGGYHRGKQKDGIGNAKMTTTKMITKGIFRFSIPMVLDRPFYPMGGRRVYIGEYIQSHDGSYDDIVNYAWPQHRGYRVNRHRIHPLLSLSHLNDGSKMHPSKKRPPNAADYRVKREHLRGCCCVSPKKKS